MKKAILRNYLMNVAPNPLSEDDTREALYGHKASGSSERASPKMKPAAEPRPTLSKFLQQQQQQRFSGKKDPNVQVAATAVSNSDDSASSICTDEDSDLDLPDSPGRGYKRGFYRGEAGRAVRPKLSVARMRERSVSEDHAAVKSPRAEFLQPTASWEDAVSKYQYDVNLMPTLEEARLLFGFR